MPFGESETLLQSMSDVVAGNRSVHDSFRRRQLKQTVRVRDKTDTKRLLFVVSLGIQMHTGK